jgi:organic radical activating enzyme
MSEELKYPISEIFTAPQGEGLWAGTLMTFIRFAGCNVGKSIKGQEEVRVFHNSEKEETLNRTKYGIIPIWQEECITFDGRKFCCFASFESIPIILKSGYIRKIPLINVCKGDKVFSWTKKGIVENKVLRIEHRWMDESDLMTIWLQKETTMDMPRSVVVSRDHRFLNNNLEWKQADKLKITSVLQHHILSKRLLARCPSLSERMRNSRLNGIEEGRITFNISRKTRKLHSDRMRKNNPMKDPKVAEKSRRNRENNAGPSGPERKIIRLAEQVDVNLKFVGNGKYFVRQKDKIKNPDFIIPGEKKVVEVYDSSFHYMGKRRNGHWERGIKTFYDKSGYSCLPIDVNKLSNEDIKDKLSQFAGNGFLITRIQSGFAGNTSKWKENSRGRKGFKLSDVIKGSKKGERKIMVTEIEVDGEHNYIGPYGTINHNCDTDFRVKERLTADEILQRVPLGVDHICITGGEPLIHNLSQLVEKWVLWKRTKHSIHIETSGTKIIHFNCPQIVNATEQCWVTVSPKANFIPSMIRRANEVKFLVDNNFNELEAEAIAKLDTDGDTIFWLSPINGINTLSKENTNKCLEIQSRHPNWRLTNQNHKIWGTR